MLILFILEVWLHSVSFGYKTYLLKDACRAINKNPGNGDAALDEMQRAGAEIIETKDVIK